jgi:NAD(P)-dependent dehydrogenase (short-subunit alcohol dehydrogenase family)
MRTAIVTGAAQGVGRATAALLSRLGYRVVLVDLQSVEAQVERLRSAGAAAEGACGDVSSEPFVQELAQRIERDHGAADVLVSRRR